MEYRIVEKPAMRLIGYKRRFDGTPGSEGRWQQEHDFACETRMNQYLLWGMSGNQNDLFAVLKNLDPDGYDFYFASEVPDWDICARGLGEEAGRFEVIDLPVQRYVICETEHCQWPCNIHNDLRRQMVSQWLPTSGFRLAEAPELALIHWPYEKPGQDLKHTRYVQVWLPIEKNVE